MAALPDESEIEVSHATLHVEQKTDKPASWTQADRKALEAAQAPKPANDMPAPVHKAEVKPEPVPVVQQAPATKAAEPVAPEPMLSFPAAPQPDPVVLGEIKEIRQLLQEQMSMLVWKDSVERQPHRANLWKELTLAGFSPVLARTVVENMPSDIREDNAQQWLNDVMLRNLPVTQASEDIVDKGGVYALVGPTGVGKTTTTAKLAARCVVKYGAASIGLITTDSYRIGAQDQLRIYGKILGVQVYTAQTEQDIAQLLQTMERKHLVLIDTVGMGQRDLRVVEQTDMLHASNVKRILVLNAAAQPETLDDVAKHYRGSGLYGAILTKLDEAVKLGGVLDVAMRYRLGLHYMATGQRVPEDLYPAQAAILLKRALKPNKSSTFSLSEQEQQWNMANMHKVDSNIVR